MSAPKSQIAIHKCLCGNAAVVTIHSEYVCARCRGIEKQYHSFLKPSSGFAGFMETFRVVIPKRKSQSI